MRFARYCLVVAGAALIALTHTSSAWAGPWVLPVSGAAPTLGFGVQYAGGTHRGVDLEAAAGAEVLAPAGGTVTFAGRVPADGGGTCGAVTVELADGYRVSLMPLEGVCVTTGEGVCAGDVLGSLAASGDDSSAAPHLHVGLRSGELYLDPAAYLPVGGGAATSPVPESAPVTVPDPPAATSVGVAPAASATPVVSAVAEAEPMPVSASAVAETPIVDVAATADVAPVIPAAELPVTEVVDPNDAPHTVSKGARTPFFSARPVTSGVLALGMLATGIAIVRVRRASPVHVR